MNAARGGGEVNGAPAPTQVMTRIAHSASFKRAAERRGKLAMQETRVCERSLSAPFRRRFTEKENLPGRIAQVGHLIMLRQPQPLRETGGFVYPAGHGSPRAGAADIGGTRAAEAALREACE